MAMQKLAILYDASQAVLSTFDLEEVLRRILSIVRDVFHLEKGAILLLDSKTQELYLKTEFGWEPGSDQIRVPLGLGLTGSAAQLRQPVYAPDVSKDPRYICSLAATRSELAIPLQVRDQVVGVLDCQSERLNFFDQETLQLLTLFSTQASIALENTRLYSLEQRRRSQLEAINTIARQTTAVLEIGKLAEDVCSLTLESFGGDHASLLLFDEDRLVLRANKGSLTPLFIVGDEVPAVEGLLARALGSEKPIVENDVRRTGEYRAGSRETLSAVCLPLVSFGQVLGLLVLESAHPDAFQPEDVNALESVADICAIAIQNARNFEQVRQLAYIDGLTGAFNRRYFEVRMAEEVARSSRHRLTFSVIMIDIDHFKELNDHFGHLRGDDVLRQVSAILSQQLRRSDVVTRYGGEEFAIIAPEINLENAFAVADRLRRVLESWHFPGVTRSVTISAGVAEFPSQGRTRDEIVSAADEALYAAKQGCRNRVIAARVGHQHAKPGHSEPPAVMPKTSA
jgi:diguanylate cyclase (GGDEF)-like protein